MRSILVSASSLVLSAILARPAHAGHAEPIYSPAQLAKVPASSSALGAVQGDGSTVTLSAAGVLSHTPQNIINGLGFTPLNKAGDTMGGPLVVSGEVQSNTQSAFRSIQGGYGAIWYNDGGHYYLLLTNQGAATGTFNGLRPFYVELDNGLVSMQTGLAVVGGLNADKVSTPHNVLDDGSGNVVIGGQVTSSLTMRPPAGISNDLLLYHTLTGSRAGAFTGSYLSYTDSAKLTGSGSGFNAFTFAHQILAGVEGQRGTVDIQTQFQGADDGVTPNPNYVAFAPSMVVNSGDGGTGTTVSTSRGAFFAGNPVASAVNAPNLYELTGYEIDVSLDAKSSAYYKSALSLVEINPDATQGYNTDALLVLSAQPGVPGMKTVIEIGGDNGGVPYNASSTLINVYGGGAKANVGVDMSGATFGSCAFRYNSFCVDNSGNVKAPGANITGQISLGTTSSLLQFPGTSGTFGSASGGDVQFSGGQLYLDNSEGGFVLRNKGNVLLNLFSGTASFNTGITAANLPTSSTAAAKGTVCSDSNGVLYVKTTSGACL